MERRGEGTAGDLVEQRRTRSRYERCDQHNYQRNQTDSQCDADDNRVVRLEGVIDEQSLAATFVEVPGDVVSHRRWP